MRNGNSLITLGIHRMVICATKVASLSVSSLYVLTELLNEKFQVMQEHLFKTYTSTGVCIIFFFSGIVWF